MSILIFIFFSVLLVPRNLLVIHTIVQVFALVVAEARVHFSESDCLVDASLERPDSVEQLQVAAVQTLHEHPKCALMRHRLHFEWNVRFERRGRTARFWKSDARSENSLLDVQRERAVFECPKQRPAHTNDRTV